MDRRILVPLDGSARAETVLPKVVVLATALQAEVQLLRVAKAQVFPGVDPTEAQVRVVREAEDYLAVMVEQLRLWGVPARAAVRYGEPVPEILDHIRSNGVSLVAMASRGRGAMRRLILGSVAAAVLRHAGVPVLLLGPEGQASEFLTTATGAQASADPRGVCPRTGRSGHANSSR
jgi:nucleotide-binding universal stress UspA family protein